MPPGFPRPARRPWRGYLAGTFGSLTGLIIGHLLPPAFGLHLLLAAVLAVLGGLVALLLHRRRP